MTAQNDIETATAETVKAGDSIIVDRKPRKVLATSIVTTETGRFAHIRHEMPAPWGPSEMLNVMPATTTVRVIRAN